MITNNQTTPGASRPPQGGAAGNSTGVTDSPFVETASAEVRPIRPNLPMKTGLDGEKLQDLSDTTPRRWGWLLLIVGFGGLVAWGVFAPLDQGASAPGQVIVSGQRKAVQSVTSGRIEALLVKENDVVTAGQPLVTLDATAIRANLEASRADWFTALATEARLIAERQSNGRIVFPPALMSQMTEARAAAAMAVQQQIYTTRRTTLEGEIGSINENIAGLEIQIKSLQSVMASKEEQVKLLNLELKGQRELANDGYLPRNRLWEQERLMAQLTGAISDDIGNIGRAKSAIAELRMRATTRRNEFSRDVETQLSEVQRTLSTLAQRLRAYEFELSNNVTKAPTDGKVVGLAIHTVGGVINSGMLLMEIVPTDEPLRIEAQVPTYLIDKVRPATQVDILFPAFNQVVTPHVPGRVLAISADSLVDQRTGAPYYKAQVVVTPEGMAKLKKHEIRAGMPAEIFFRTGERTAFNYLFKPLTDRLRTALTEE